MSQSRKKWYVYIILASDQRLYAGITTDLARRWSEHSGSGKGAKFFRGRHPEQLVFAAESDGRSSATKLEIQIKKMSRADKLKLIASDQNDLTLLSHFDLS